MDALIAAANSAGIRGLIDTYYDAGDVQGFALGVHGSFVSMFRAEFGRTFGINDILSADKTPAGWPDLCSAAGYTTTLSPIYVVIYVSVRASDFRANAKPPLMVMPNYAVFAESMAPFTARADRGKHRPIEGGTSVGSDSKPNHSGTLGGFLDDGGSQIYLLSCQHVLLNQHDTVVQQGSGDGGAAPVDAVGATAHVVPLVPPSGFTASAPYNQVDAALARVDPHISVSSAVRLLGAVKKTVPTSNLALGDDVVFVGKESDSQDSYVHHYIARVKVNIEKTVYNFGDLFEIRPRLKLYIGSLSKAGDSGAFVVRETAGVTDELCGLLIAGNGKKAALCCYVDNVINSLNGVAGSSFKLH